MRVCEVMLPFFTEKSGNAAKQEDPSSAGNASDVVSARNRSWRDGGSKDVVFTSGAMEVRTPPPGDHQGQAQTGQKDGELHRP